MNRIFVYCSVFFGAYLFFVIIILLGFFEIIVVELSPITYMYACLDIGFVLGIILCMLYFGATVNFQFISDKQQLLKIKSTLLYIKLNIEDVRNKTKYTGAYLKMFAK
jgi:hypothetical protein